jgi:hypothetical protein
MMKSGKLMAVLVGVLSIAALVGADRKAKTEDGKEVILRDDGTWVYADEVKKNKKELNREFKKDKNAKLQYTGKRGTFALSLVPGVWERLEKPPSPAAEVGFRHKDGDAFGLVIAERIAIPLETLKRAAIENVRNVDRDAQIVDEERRTVNGKEVLCLTLKAKPQGAPLTFYNYYYSGKEGAIQITTWTGENLFDEMKPELEAFLNGFEIIKK